MRVVIADDEPLARERLRALLGEIGGVEIVADAADGHEALHACAEHKPDLVLLDIAMPGIDGLETARHLAAFDPRPAVVFCTASTRTRCRRSRPRRSTTWSSRCAPSAWRRRWSGCAPSPPGAWHRAAAARNGQRRSHLCARLRGSLRLIPLEDVHYLHAEEKYVIVHHARGEDLIEESLKSLEEEFGERFVRIHRNCLVARHEIVELKRGADGHVHAVLRHGKQPLEVSRRCVSGLRETLTHL